MEHAGIPDDSVASVRVPRGYKLELHRYNDGDGEYTAIVGNTDEYGFMPCVNLVNMSDMEDKTSSIIIRPLA